MNKSIRLIRIGDELIHPISGGLYHALIEIDGQLYHKYDNNIVSCVRYLCDIKNRLGSGKSTGETNQDVYRSGNISMTVEDDKYYEIVISILDRSFTLITSDKEDCLKALEVLGAIHSRRPLEMYRASYARYAWSIIKYGPDLRPAETEYDGC